MSFTIAFSYVLYELKTSDSSHMSILVLFLKFYLVFEISEGILRNQKIDIGLDSFSNQHLINLAPFG